MNFINLAEIVISPNRQRALHDPDAHMELVGSIETNGLLQAIVLRGNTLVAGERRIKAVQEISDLGGSIRYGVLAVPPGMIPFMDMGELSPLEAEEAELEENVRRKDLTWQERAKAEERLLNLRNAQADLKGLPHPGIASIAKETRGEVTPALARSVSTNVILARNMHRPEVASAKSPAEAMKAMVRAEESERNAEKAAALGKDFLGSKHTLHNGDSQVYLRGMPDHHFDIILTDPIYGMGADEFGDSGGGAAGAHFYKDDYEAWEAMMDWFAPESFRIAKQDAHLYAFLDIRKFEEMSGYMAAAGWKVFRTPLIWFKPSAFRAPWPEQGPQRKYETILYAVKGDLKCTKIAGDVIQCPADENLGHHAQKPVELFRDLLSRSARPGMRVLDPFCGSGPIFPAAHSLSAIATGVELDPAAYGIAAGRLEKLREGG